MYDLISHPVFLVLLTVALFFAAKLLQARTRFVLCNPLLLSIVALILFLSASGIPYSAYEKACAPISFWVQPVIVALGVPLYLQLRNIRRDFLPLVVSQLVACISGVCFGVLFARLLGAPETICLSVAPKSITMPIALEVSSHIDGAVQSLTAAAVLGAGLFGSVLGPSTVRLLGIRSFQAQGAAIGAACHAFGTAAAFETHPTAGAYASLGLTINGILTAVLTMHILHFLP
ncbi:MAG: LrgB family protein [Paludibacteraceae bacterium]|jgi:predicted murein hydrolase (TIGR00659 family)|nr:LrgB family protein [Paludibacteraceae bacterium]